MNDGRRQHVLEELCRKNERDLYRHGLRKHPRACVVLMIFGPHAFRNGGKFSHPRIFITAQHVVLHTCAKSRIVRKRRERSHSTRVKLDRVMCLPFRSRCCTLGEISHLYLAIPMISVFFSLCFNVKELDWYRPSPESDT